MSNIELVIKIDEEIYKARQHWIANPKRMVDEVDIAIANGTPITPDILADLLMKERLKEEQERGHLGIFS